MAALAFKDLTLGQSFVGLVAVKKCSVLEDKKGKKYLAMTVTDGQEDMSAVFWDHKGPCVPQVNTVICFDESTITEYRGEKQFTVNRWRNAEKNEYTPGQFIPVCPVPLTDLWNQYYELRDMVTDEDYGTLLDTVIYNLPGRDSKFILVPGAKGIHHAYISGLLEHSIGVAKIALAMAGNDETINKELLITGALLHDLGKVREYDYTGCVIERTDNGKLLGHIIQGVMMLTEAYTLLYLDELHKISDKKMVLLTHLIASHHGRLEWGSPVEPQTKEAIILHHADMLDYQSHVINQAINKTAQGEMWTGKAAGINREFYVGARENKQEEVKSNEVTMGI